MCQRGEGGKYDGNDQKKLHFKLSEGNKRTPRRKGGISTSPSKRRCENNGEKSIGKKQVLLAGRGKVEKGRSTSNVAVVLLGEFNRSLKKKERLKGESTDQVSGALFFFWEGGCERRICKNRGTTAASKKRKGTLSRKKRKKKGSKATLLPHSKRRRRGFMGIACRPRGGEEPF